MLSSSHKDIIKSTAPLVKEHSVTITTKFYEVLFERYPFLKSVFNQSHQNDNSQQVALADAIVDYALNIDNPNVLLPKLESIAQKHVAHNVQPEQYSTVGDTLLEVVADVLSDHITSDIAEAWQAGYDFLAALLINLEKNIYSNLETNGWIGFRKFQIVKKVGETDNICSFYLRPIDGKSIMPFKSGQFISIRFENLDAVRIYSLSGRPSSEYYRITVKTDGLVSRYLHQYCDENTPLDISAPLGTFELAHNNKPAVLISGGIGITPFVSMVENCFHQGNKMSLTHFHCDRSYDSIPFRKELGELDNCMNNYNFYPLVSEGDDIRGIHKRLTPEFIKSHSPGSDCDFYICGSPVFMEAVTEMLLSLGVSSDHFHYEFFGVSKKITPPSSLPLKKAV